METMLERPFRPRSREVEPLSYPVCLVHCQVQKPSEEWWIAWYLPDLDSANQVQQVLYEYRVALDPSQEAQLATKLSQWKQDFACSMYERLGSLDMEMEDASGPVFLLMGPHVKTLSYRRVQRYLSVVDSSYVPQMTKVMQHAKDDPDLQQALEDFRDYRHWTKQQTNLRQVLLPPKSTTATTRATSIAHDHGDSATVVTNASTPVEEVAVQVHVTKPTANKRKDSRARSKSRSRPSKRLKTPPKKSSPKSVAAQPSVAANSPTLPSTNELDPVTPQQQAAGKSHSPAEESSATKFNRQALAEANGYRKPSPKSTKSLGRRRVFPTMDPERAPVALDKPLLKESETPVMVPDESPVEEQSAVGQCSVMEEENAQQEQQVQEQNLPQAQQHESPSQREPRASLNPQLDMPEATIDVEQHQHEEAQPEIHLEPIPPVDLPGNTVQEKLNSCLNALRKENENIVACHKIHIAQQTILDFFHSIVQSKGVAGPKGSPPILHVCGAPGSGKSMTVELCTRMVTEAYTNGANEWDVPPRFCFINCSHLQNHSKQDALASTLQYADRTENSLKRPKNNADCTRPTVIFILDEIDYLVSKNSKGTKSEQYIQTLLEWASSSQYMVGLLGISNSVENAKAARLVDLGFSRTNKVVFRTYDEADLTRIALTKIGSAVVDEKAIEFLSKKVAGASGDARKFLEILSRSISSAMEELSPTTLNAIHDKPVIKVPHFMKTFKSSTIKTKDLIESSPAHEKHILCVCIHLARTIGSRPFRLSRLLSICQQVFEALDLTSVTELTSILGRLADSGLLKWAALKDDKIRFDIQLEDVESAVEEVLLIQNFYRTTLEKLERLDVAQWADS